MIKISIIIPTLHRPKDIEKTIDSIFESSLLPYKIIVVDQSDSDDTKKALQGFNKSNITYYHISIQSGSKARNFWITKIPPDTDIVLFLDDDVTLAKDCLSTLASYIDEYHPKWWVLNIDTPTRSINLPKKIWFFLMTGSNKFDEQFVTNGWFNAMFLSQPQTTKTVERCSGCAMFFHRSLFDEWFQFPKHFQKYSLMEDVFLSYAIHKKYPNTLHYLPNAKIIHHESPIRSIPPKTKIMQNIIHRFLFVKEFNLSYVWYFWTTTVLWLLDMMSYKKFKVAVRYVQWMWYVYKNHKNISLNWTWLDYNEFIFSE